MRKSPIFVGSGIISSEDPCIVSQVIISNDIKLPEPGFTMENDINHPRISVILSQKENHLIRMDILKVRDYRQSKPSIMDALTIPDDHWDPEKSEMTWRMIFRLMENDLLCHEDMLQLLTCRNICTSLHVWGGGEIFIDMLLLERPDFEENKRHLFRILTKCDGRYNPVFSGFVWDAVSFMMEYHCMTVRDILTLLVSTNDSVSFTVWSNVELLSRLGYVSDSDLAKHKSWFIGLLADHPEAWHPQYPRDFDEDSLWYAISYMAENMILTREDICGLLDLGRDDLIAAVWLHAQPLRRFGLLEPDDLRKTKHTFLSIVTKSLEGATLSSLAPPDQEPQLLLWRVIRDAFSPEWEVITPEDDAFFMYLLSCRNDAMFLSVWKNGDDLVRRGFLKREDFLSHKNRLNALALAENIWKQGSFEENKRLLKFLLDIGLCTTETLQQAAEAGCDNLPVFAEGVLKDLAINETIRTLIQDLGHANPIMRSAAAWDLEHSNEQGITERLVPLLRHRDARVRYHAAEIIAKRHPLTTTFTELIVALGDDNPDVRLQVCHALKGHPSDRVRETFATVRNVRYHAFDEIASAPVVDEVIVAAMEKKEDLVREVAAQVVRGKWRSEDSFIGDLGRRDPFALHSAASAVVPMVPDSIITELVTGMASADTGQKITYIRALGRFRSVRAAVAIVPAITDPFADVRFAAARALGNMGVVAVADYLIILLRDRDAGVRYCAAEALGKIRSDKAVDGLVRALADPDEAVRFHAALALGKIGSGRGIVPLTAALEDSNILVSVAAGEALRRIGKPAEASEQTP